jgi:predicted DNA-binding ribbon-helix-helix protein
MLVNRNISVGDHRTSIRLEPEFWAALADIAEREHLTIDQLCTEVDRHAGELSRTAAVRIFIMSYAVKMSGRNNDQLEFKLVENASGRSEAENVDQYPVPFQRHRVVG